MTTEAFVFKDNFHLFLIFMSWSKSVISHCQIRFNPRPLFNMFLHSTKLNMSRQGDARVVCTLKLKVCTTGLKFRQLFFCYIAISAPKLTFTVEPSPIAATRNSKFLLNVCLIDIVTSFGYP